MHPQRVTEHDVRFFNESDYPTARIAGYLRDGLALGGAAFTYATNDHLSVITAALGDLGIDVSGKIATGQIVLDHADDLAAAMVAQRQSAFDARIAARLNDALGKFGKVWIYSEVVDVLARAGDHASALELERRWNQLLDGKPAAMLCGYALGRFADASLVSEFRRVCHEHVLVEPVGDEVRGSHGRVVAELQQMVVALRKESQQLLDSERQQQRLRGQAHAASEHVARLQRLTSALSEATTRSGIGEVVAAEVPDIFSADVAVLVLAIEDGKKLELAGHANLPRHVARRFRSFAVEAPVPIATSFRTGAPLWLMSAEQIGRDYPATLVDNPDAQAIGCLPIMVRGRCLGALGVSYNSASRANALDRALLEDYVRQVAIAVERAESYEDAQRARGRLQILADAAGRIARAGLDLKQVTDAVARECTHAGFAHSCAINLRREETDEFPLAVLYHVDPEAGAEAERILRAMPVVRGRGIAGGVAQSGRAVRITTEEGTVERAYSAYRPYLAKYPVSSMIAVPLRSSSKILGTVTAARHPPSPPFTVEDEQLLQELADRATLSIENAMLYERARHDRERAESANRAKDEFMARLGHELRNPLAPILTATQLIRLRAGDTLDRERGMIERQVEHMVRLVDDLLDVSRITTGKVELRRAPVELAPLVASAIEIVSPLLEERRHRLTMAVPHAGLLLDADADRLSQVIANLLTNAAKYTPPGGLIEITAAAQDGSVSLTVRDNGAGIDSELQPHIFDLFVQGRQASDRAKGGLGLGLAIARNLVEMHGGTLRARSDGIGKGSEFVLGLPLAAGHPASAPKATLATASNNGIRHKVLVVDDNVDAADSLRHVLQSFGHSVAIAHDGPSALRVAEQERPDLAFLDVGLPVMDGYELGRRLLSTLGDSAPKIVALTGYGQESDRRRSAEAGFDDHAVKPISLERLQSIIDRLLSPAENDPPP